MADRIDHPRNERSRRTRRAILDATWALLESVGPEGTTMAAVAERAGITRRALYLHVTSRAELFLAVHAHVDERLDLGASIRPVAEASDAVGALEEFAAHLARYHPKILSLDIALLAEARNDLDVAELVERGALMWRDECRNIAARLADEGRLAEPWSVDTAADLLWTFMFPETLQRLNTQRGWSPDTYRDLLAVVFRRTLVTCLVD
jgi:AcrR family transcriptional regulator